MAIDGTYNIVANTPMGAQETKLEIKTAGNVVTGSGTSTNGTSQIENGKVEGKVATFIINTTTPFGAMQLDFKLTFDGDKVSGEASTPFGAMPIEGKRA
jgi:hypothetical protein